jgi:hypothetical protein
LRLPIDMPMTGIVAGAEVNTASPTGAAAG